MYFKYKSLYEAKDLIDILKLTHPDILFIDVGANIGFVSVFMAKRINETGGVYAIEPEGENFKQLESNLDSFKNTAILQSLVSEQNTTRYLKINPMHPADHKLARNMDGIPVQSITLDSLYESIIEGRPVLNNAKVMIKVDVQGAELLVLKGAQELISKVKPDFMLEVDQKSYGEYDYDINTLMNFMKDNGYVAFLSKKNRIIKVVPELLSTSEYQDVLFIHHDRLTSNSLSIQLQK